MSRKFSVICPAPAGHTWSGSGGDDEGRVVPLGHVDDAGHRLLGRQPHQPVALDDVVGAVAHDGLRRDRRTVRRAPGPATQRPSSP